MTKYNSGRVKRFPQSGITSDRYEYLGLEQAEPDLGDPLVGVSSIGTNPFTPGFKLTDEHYVLTAVEGYEGERFWIPSLDIVTQGVQGVQGAQGPQGAQGTQGIPSPTINIIGIVPDVTAGPGTEDDVLNAFVLANVEPVGTYTTQPGDGIIDNATNDFWVWINPVDQWLNVGEIRGPQGVQGTQGLGGAGGTQGVQGSQSAQSAQGTQGAQGVQNAQGAQGPQGTQSAQGTQSTQGAQGVQSSQGAQGTQGAQSAQGSQGVQNAQ